MERIRRNGTSEVLWKLSKSAWNVIGDTDHVISSMDVTPMTVVAKPVLKVTIECLEEWVRLDREVEEVTVASKCCKESGVKVLDLSGFAKLQEWNVGDYCFQTVEVLKLIGLTQLERVVIGYYCFADEEYNVQTDKMNPNRRFYLKNCERLRELRIDCWSFCDYSVCEIENVPSLEVITIGEWDDSCNNFLHASMALRSDYKGMR